MPKLEDRKGTEAVVARFVITHHENGSLSIAGPIDNKEYCLAVLENAKDAVRNHRRPGMVDLIIPGRDVSTER